MSKQKVNINLPTLFKLLKEDKKKMLIYASIFSILGIIVALGTPKTYKASVMLAPEESGGGFSGSLTSLASMVGLNMGGNQTGDAIYPEIYPELMKSVKFNVELLPIEIRTSKSAEVMPYYTYMTKYQKTPILAYPIVWLTKLSELFSKDNATTQLDSTQYAFGINPFYLNRKQAKLLENISEKIVCNVDKKTSIITITVSAQDPLVAALMADSVKNHLQLSITEYKTQKARENVIYMERLFQEAKNEYDRSRKDYAQAVDSYKNLSRQTYQSMIDDLEAEKDLKYAIYQQVVEQLQIAKSILQEKTPAFTVIQNSSVPSLPSGRSRKAIVLIWAFMGIFLRSSVLFVKKRDLFIAEDKTL